MTLPTRSEHEGHDLALLTGNGAAEMLRIALGARTVVRSWSVHSLHHRPGAGVTVCYDVVVDHYLKDGRIERGQEYVCASTARLSRPQDSALTHLQADGTKVSIWRYPNDPELPALPMACSPVIMSELLGELVGIELMSYRPTRRAVVKVVRGDGNVGFGKVLRPASARELVERHRILQEANVGAPRVILSNDDGLVLSSNLPGEPLANLLSRGMGKRTPMVLEELVGVLDSLPRAALNFRERPAWADRAEHYGHAAATAVPEVAERCRAIALRVNALLPVADSGPIVPVHGDFYEANVFVVTGGSRVSGIIDVDSIGPGHRVDDLACLLGHISVLPHLAPRSYPHVGEVLPVWASMCERMVDPVALNARAAGVVLSLVAGAKRLDGREWRTDALGRVSTAEWWLDRAELWAAHRGVR